MRNDFEDALAAVQKEVWHTATIEIPNLKAVIEESLSGVDISGLEARVSDLETQVAELEVMAADEPSIASEVLSVESESLSSGSLVPIFDYTHSDADINKGFSSAMKPSEVLSADFSQYSKLVVHMRATSSGNTCAFEIPVTQKDAVQNSSFMFASTRQGWSEIFLQLSADKQILNYSTCSHFSTETSSGETTLKYQNSISASYGGIEKIEGYLK